jgi:hypothetical protein
MDHADPVPGLVERIEEMVVMDPRQGIDRVDPVPEQGVDHGLSGGHADRLRAGFAAGGSLLALFRH